MAISDWRPKSILSELAIGRFVRLEINMYLIFRNKGSRAGAIVICDM